MIRKSTSTSAALSAEIGSSMISTRASCANARDLDDLLLTETQVADQGARVERLLEAPHQAGGDLALRLPVDQDAAPAALAGHEQVVRDAEIGKQAELLVDDHDAALGGVAGRAQDEGLA